ncbi:hypothetical protein [Mesobacillus boroniphilus]|nr:hypothetical protein [Mesobacillus boroniphilus]
MKEKSSKSKKHHNMTGLKLTANLASIHMHGKQELIMFLLPYALG